MEGQGTGSRPEVTHGDTPFASLEGKISHWEKDGKLDA